MQRYTAVVHEGQAPGHAPARHEAEPDVAVGQARRAQQLVVLLRGGREAGRHGSSSIGAQRLCL